LSFWRKNHELRVQCEMVNYRDAKIMNGPSTNLAFFDAQHCANDA